MNPIRQALHKAARHYCKQAHEWWCNMQMAQESGFIFALRGLQKERQRANKRFLECNAEYTKMMHCAHRCRRMMK